MKHSVPFFIDTFREKFLSKIRKKKLLIFEISKNSLPFVDVFI